MNDPAPISVLSLDAMPDGCPRPEFGYAAPTAEGCPYALPASGQRVDLIRDRQGVIQVVSDRRFTVDAADGITGNALRSRRDFIVLDEGITRYKLAIGPFFTGKHLQSEIPLIEKIARDLVPQFPPRPGADLVEFADQYIGRVVTMSMGVPYADWHERIFEPVYIDALNVPISSEAAKQSIGDAWAGLYAYVATIIEKVRRGGYADRSLLGRIIQALDTRCRFTDKQTQHTVATLTSGWSSPFAVMTRVMAEMLRDPDRIATCVARPDLWQAWIWEIMKGSAHFSLGNVRQAQEDVQVGPLLIRKGGMVLPSWTGALQDPVGPPNLSAVPTGMFGYSSHRCPSVDWSMRVLLIGIAAYFAEHRHVRLAVPFTDLTWIGPGLLTPPAKIPVRQRSGLLLADKGTARL